MFKLLPFDMYIRQALLHPLTSPFLPPIDKVEKDYSYAAGKRIGTLEAGGNYGLPKTGQTDSQIDYDDGWYEKGYPLTGDRFTDNGDGTITDNATGLMWVKDGSGAGCNNGDSANLAGAITFAEGLTFATHSDWRLPNVKELQSIVDYGRNNPCIAALFINCVSNYYWSSTFQDRNLNKAFAIDFYDGFIWSFATSTSYSVRPVRDA